MGLSNGGVTLRVRRAQEPWNKYGALIVKRRMLVKYLASTAAESAASAKAARRRGTAAANSLGRVVLAVWTTAGLASAASPPAKSAGAACGRVAFAERCGIDSVASSSDYIQLYKGDCKLLGESLGRIQTVSKRIIDSIGLDDCRSGSSSALAA